MTGCLRTPALLACLAVGLSCPAVSAGVNDPALPPDGVRALVAAYESSSRAICGIHVIDLRTGESLVSIRGQELFIPASNQKLLTSAGGLAKLGADFKFVTSVYRLGQDIVVVGDGDPVLGDPVLAEQTHQSIYAELDRWAQAVKTDFGPQSAGDLVVSSGFEPGSFRHADWPGSQLDRWYAAPVAGLNFHNNCFDVTFTATGDGLRPQVAPQSRFIRVASSLKSGKRQVWSLRSSSDDSQVELRGTVAGASKDPISVAANDPPMLLAWVFADRLIRAEVGFAGRVRTADLKELDLSRAKLLCRTTTPLEVVLKRANKRSLNMAAECILLRAGDGTWDASAQAMAAALVQHYGLAAEEMVIRDGSGLSKLNRVTPQAVARVLAGVAKRQDGKIILASLPASGLDGTMRKRLAQQPYVGRVLAKTGYVAGASCLSGYVLDRDERPAVAFSILVNEVPGGKGYLAHRLEDSICALLVDFCDGDEKDPRPPVSRNPPGRQKAITTTAAAAVGLPLEKPSAGR